MTTFVVVVLAVLAVNVLVLLGLLIHYVREQSDHDESGEEWEVVYVPGLFGGDNVAAFSSSREVRRLRRSRTTWS